MTHLQPCDLRRLQRMADLERQRQHLSFTNGMPKGYCPYCGSFNGLDEEGNACGHCSKGITRLREEKKRDR